MIKWEQKDIEFIVDNILKPVLSVMIEENVNGKKAEENEYKKIVDIITDEIAEIRYERQKDMRFIIQMLSVARGQISTNEVDELYKLWCKEFDELNLHLLKEKTDET